MKAEDFYDINVLKKNTGDDPAFTAHMINLFLKQAPLQLEELKTAADKADWDAMSKTAHKMKSGFRSMGIHSLVEDALAFEEDGRELQNLDTISERVATFEAKLIATLEFLSQEL